MPYEQRAADFAAAYESMLAFNRSQVQESQNALQPLLLQSTAQPHYPQRPGIVPQIEPQTPSAHWGIQNPAQSHQVGAQVPPYFGRGQLQDGNGLSSGPFEGHQAHDYLQTPPTIAAYASHLSPSGNLSGLFGNNFRPSHIGEPNAQSGTKHNMHEARVSDEIDSLGE